MNWYYSENAQQLGPIGEAEFERLIATGKITPTTLVWREGMTEWQPLSKVRPSGGVIPPAPGSDRCASCGNVFPAAELISIEGRPICATCKPVVMQRLQEGAAMPEGGSLVRTGPPWENRATLGLWQAIFQTIKGVLFNPAVTFQNMKREGGLGTPLTYLMIVGSVGGIVGVIYNVMFQSVGMLSQLRANQQSAIFGGLGLVGILVISAVVMPLAIAAGAFIGSGITHLCLMLVGGANRPYETTFRVLCYSSASTAIFQLVPICGSSIAAIWGLVANCIGLARAHEISTGKAVAAVLLPMVVCCGLAVVLVIVFAGVIGAAAAHH